MLWLKHRQLASKDAAVRRKAMQELCDSPSARAIDILRTALDDDDAEVRRLAVMALSRIEDDRRLDPLLIALRDREPEVIKTTIMALKKFPLERVITALVPLIFNADAGVRGYTVQTLDGMGWKPTNREEEIWYLVAKNQLARAATHGIAALPALECVLIGGPYNLRVAAVDAISSIDDKRAQRPLMTALKSLDPAVAAAAVEALSNTGDPQIIPAIATVLRHGDAHARVVTCEALGRMNAQVVAEQIRPLLKDPAWDVRKAAAEALGRMKDVKSVDALGRNLNDPDNDVREATALALGNVHDRRAIGPLIKALKDPNAGVRRIASGALARIDENWSTSSEAMAAIEELKSALLDKDPDVRYLVGKLLTSLGQNTSPEVAVATPKEDKLSVNAAEKRRRQAVGLFVAILYDEDRDLRLAAAEALGRLGDERAHAALIRSLGDNDARVRQAADAAMTAIKAQRTAAN